MPSSVPIITIPDDPIEHSKYTPIIEYIKRQTSSFVVGTPYTTPSSPPPHTNVETIEKYSSDPFTITVGTTIPIPSTFPNISQVHVLLDTPPEVNPNPEPTEVPEVHEKVGQDPQIDLMDIEEEATSTNNTSSVKE
jgi:hypothetical protein